MALNLFANLPKVGEALTLLVTGEVEIKAEEAALDAGEVHYTNSIVQPTLDGKKRYIGLVVSNKPFKGGQVKQ